MDAVILAAGLGSRLRPLTSNVPKAMVKYKQKEIISYQIENLQDLKIKKIIVITGYHSDILTKFIKNNFDNITIVNNDAFHDTNSAFSFTYATNQISSDSYIHLNCDILFSKDILSNLIDCSYLNAICVRDDLILTDAMENIKVNESNKIVNMSLKNDDKSQFKGYGLAKLSKKALNNNLKLFNSMKGTIRKKENYFGLIRNNLENDDYYIVKSDKYNLAEINSSKDLNVCSFQSDL